MKEFTTLEEAVKTMKKEELKHQLLIMNEVWNDFEAFLEEKFGTGKVESLSKEFVLWKAKKGLSSYAITLEEDEEAKA